MSRLLAAKTPRKTALETLLATLLDMVRREVALLALVDSSLREAPPVSERPDHVADAEVPASSGPPPEVPDLDLLRPVEAPGSTTRHAAREPRHLVSA